MTSLLDAGQRARAALQLDPDLLPDADGVCDLQLSGLAHPVTAGGFLADDPLLTAVIICLMTDARVRPEQLRTGDVNAGWPGDMMDDGAGAFPLGSRLWQLRRARLNDETLELAEIYAREALQSLITQGAFVRFDVRAERTGDNALALDVTGYGRDGAQRFHRRFAPLWRAQEQG